MDGDEARRDPLAGLPLYESSSFSKFRPVGDRQRHGTKHVYIPTSSTQPPPGQVHAVQAENPIIDVIRRSRGVAASSKDARPPLGGRKRHAPEDNTSDAEDA